MIGGIISLLAILATYLLGSIPFGLLIARWFGKVDIRTVGSGNIGATNVGRVLGFRYFVIVFALDFLKGFLPTLYLSDVASRASGAALPHLPVGVAIAAILGHNFPIFLRFRGGKGVATSLGAVSALDPVASLASATGFATFLLLTRYVSMSSILGGLAWLVAHFLRVADPLSRDHVALTVASVGLMALLIARHRKNLARIGAGTEPKIHLRRRKERPSGRAATILVVVLAVVGGGAGLALNAGRKFEAAVGPYRAAEVARVATGHQRAERLTFADRGRLLAATCPRYGRVMLYRVTDALGLELVRDIPLEGRPVAIQPTPDRLVVLVRPDKDARHVQEGYWEIFDFEGRPVGSRRPVGFYPDDLAITPEGRRALVLSSGRGEGGSHRPAPGLTVYDLDSGKEIARLAFDRPGDDPARLALSADGATAAVSLQGSNAVARVDLSDPDRPRLAGRDAWPAPSVPDALRFDRRGGLLAVDEAGQALRHQAGPSAEAETWPFEGGLGDVVEIPGEPDLWAVTLPMGSGVAFLPARSKSAADLAELPIKGRGNLAATRPMGLAYDPTRALLAVSNRSGGSIHLVALRKGTAAR